MAAKYLTAAQVRARYGGVSHMWLFRKQRDAGFPAHATRFGGQRRAWRESDLDAWDQQRIKGEA